MSSYRIKKTKGIQQILAKRLTNVADVVESAIHSPPEAFEITPEMQGLLERIKLLVGPIQNFSSEEAETTEASKGHRTFHLMNIYTDTATIQNALMFNRRERWFAPLRGGVRFLHHVISCRRCQLMIKHNVQESETADIFYSLLGRELFRRGIRPTGRPADNVRSGFTIPKPN